MVVFPAAKINLGLYVTDRRNDGYHNIETLFYPIGFSDVLEVVPAPELGAGSIGISLSGIPVEGSSDSNLVVKAYNRLNERAPLPGVNVYLHKCIPTGAGLGGGSSDGASMLVVLNSLFNLGLEQSELFGMALELGSDCPFFLESKPSFAHGRGELLSSSGVSLKGYYLQLYHPGTGISTAGAYRNVEIGFPQVPIGEIERTPVTGWKDSVFNSFERYAFEQQPVIKQIKDTLYSSGAVYASMTGSGSAVYGLFEKETTVPAGIAGYLIWTEKF